MKTQPIPDWERINNHFFAGLSPEERLAVFQAGYIPIDPSFAGKLDQLLNEIVQLHASMSRYDILPRPEYCIELIQKLSIPVGLLREWIRAQARTHTHAGEGAETTTATADAPGQLKLRFPDDEGDDDSEEVSDSPEGSTNT